MELIWPNFSKNKKKKTVTYLTELPESVNSNKTRILNACIVDSNLILPSLRNYLRLLGLVRKLYDYIGYSSAGCLLDRQHIL